MWRISASPVPQMLAKEQEQQQHQRLLAANNVVVVCDPPNAPDMALNDSFCSNHDPEILEHSLTIPHIIPKSQVSAVLPGAPEMLDLSHKLGMGRRRRGQERRNNNNNQLQS